uniref:TSO45-A4 n=1 Tax=Taenia solium TaxID=6204 RepID=Q8MUG8_TAESO|nr:TSO45-A4 [Taenia solium]
MASQFHLILLLTSILAGNHEATSWKEAREQPLHSFFLWDPPFSTKIGLKWCRGAFSEDGDKVLTLKAALTSDPNNTKTTYAKLRRGSVTLEGLTPNTSYIVTATANLSGNTILVLRKHIHTPLDDEDPMENYFHWGLVTNQSIQVSWDQEIPVEASGMIVTLTAEMVSKPSVERSESARFSVGRITVDGLMPDTLYIATVTALEDGQQFLTSTRDIRTLKTGHGGVTVVTTSGSGIASAILGLLFTCTVLVLA